MKSGLKSLVRLPLPLRLGVSVLLVALATVLNEGLWLIVDRPISAPLFLAAIVAATWLFGLRMGVFTSLVAGVAIDFFFIQPFYEISFTRDELSRLALFLIEGSLLSWLVDRLRIATEQITASREELRALTKYQQTLREEEQKRISLEIHDELGQALTGVKMEVRWLYKRLEDENDEIQKDLVAGKLDEMSKTIDSTISSIRRIATELRPSVLDDFGLIAAIEWQAREFERKSGVQCVFKSSTEDLKLDAESNTAVFRIIQEALTNVSRHAKASNVRISIGSENGDVRMKVADNGLGIHAQASGTTRSLGIIGMQERARLIGANLKIFQPTSGGTTIELDIPKGDLSVAGAG